jgi:molybdopterin converting factor small subunit
MFALQSEVRNSMPETVYVTVEAVAWVTQFVGGDGTRRQVFHEAVAPGATVRTVLVGLSDRYPRLREVLWDPASHDLAEHIEILVNDAVLGITHGVDSPVRDGDRITLLAQYAGG